MVDILKIGILYTEYYFLIIFNNQKETTPNIKWVRV